MSDEPPETRAPEIDRAVRTAEQFCHAAARGDYAVAHSYLTPEYQAVYSSDGIRADVDGMLRIYDGDPIDYVEAMVEFMLTEWPDKQAGDLAYLYVALNGPGYCEGVAMTLCETRPGIRIRTLEWGRP